MDANLNLVKSVFVYKTKAYKTRWMILFIFIMYAAVNAAQWIEYAIITNIVMKYYNVSAVAVDWTSIIYMAAYAPLAIPASYIIDKYGLRAAGLFGGLGTTIGTFIKVFSVGRDSFWLVLVGQFILSGAQVLIFALSPRLAAVWFKSNEIATACSLGVFGTQLGCAVGFIITPLMIKNHENLDEIGAELKLLQWGYTIVMIPVALALIFWFPKHPHVPPSVTQAQERQNRGKFSVKSLFGSMKIILSNGPFMIHNLAYSISIGVFCAISTFINQFVLHYFPNAEEDAGRMGLVMIVSGMIGCVVFGYFLDKTHKYKETLLFIYGTSALSMIAFMFALELQSKMLTFAAIASVGFFLNAYMPVAFEMAMELTYPSAEGTTTLLLVTPSQVVGAIFGLLLGKLIVLIGPFWSIGSQAVALTIGTVITAFVPKKLKRQAAFAQCGGDTDKL